MAKFDPCEVLPDPGADQNVVKSTNRFGCYYRQKNSRKTPGQWGNMYCEVGMPPTLYGPRNWAQFRAINYRWSHVLNDSQRLAWDTLAGLVPFRNYYGDIAYDTGHSIFHKLNRIYVQNFNVIKDDPPGAWDALAIPPVVSWSLWPGNDLIVLFPIDFNPIPELTGGAVISHLPKPGSRYPMHYFCDRLLTFGFTGWNWVTDVYIDCPFFNNQQGGQCTVGLYTVRSDTGQFSDFYWMRVG